MPSETPCRFIQETHFLKTGRPRIAGARVCVIELAGRSRDRDAGDELNAVLREFEECREVWTMDAFPQRWAEGRKYARHHTLQSRER